MYCGERRIRRPSGYNRSMNLPQLTLNDILKARRFGYALLVTAIGLGTLWLALWKCQFGIEVYDEPLYLIPGFKFLPMGEKLITSEISNAARQHDLLNFFVIKPFTDFSVLRLRELAMIVFAVILAGFCLISSKRKYSPVMLLGFCLFLLYDSVLTYSWSHNCWLRNLLLLHHASLILAFSFGEKGGKLAFSLLAGLFAGLAVIAYHPIAAGVGLLWVVFTYFAYRWNNTKRMPFFYLCGILFPVVPFLIAVLQPDTWADWLFNWKSVRTTGSYVHNASWVKAGQILTYLISRPELWAAGFLFYSEWGKEGRRRHQAFIVGVLILAVHLAYRLNQSLAEQNHWLNGACIVLGVAGAIFLTARGLARKDLASLLLGLGAASGLAIVAMASEGAQGSIYWVVPVGALPLLALSRQFSARLQITLLCQLSLMVCTALTVKMTNTYGDVPVAQCDTEITTPPLTGIRTSKRRAFLIEEVSRVAQGKDYAISYARMPLPYYFSTLRSAIGTTIIEHEAPNEVQNQILYKMITLNRTPEVLFKMRQIGWEWGKNEIFLEQYPAGYPLDLFVDCAATKKLVGYTELEVYELDARKVKDCVQSGPRLASNPQP